MGKAVLISIRPYWCKLIAEEMKTIEIRKTRPKIDTPFKCYIYCSKTKENEPFMLQTRDSHDFTCGKTYRATSGGEIIGEFTCDRIFPIRALRNGPYSEERGEDYDEEYSSYGYNDCLTDEEFDSYLKGENGYGWHISKLKVYFAQKPLSEFWSWNTGVVFEDGFPMPTHEITRPPQSWCYVEEGET